MERPSHALVSQLFLAAGLMLVASGQVRAGATANNVLCDRCVDAVDIAAKSVSTGKLANGAVSASKLKKAAVTTAKLADGAVTAAKLGKAAVKTGRLANGAVTLAKLHPEVADRLADLEATVASQGKTIARLKKQEGVHEDAIRALQREVTAVQSNSVLALDGILTYGMDANGYRRALFSGVNVQVVNGLGQTDLNGVGNLIVGYNASNVTADRHCSHGTYPKRSTCEANGGVWARDHKTGSHNLVGGDGNSYSSYGGLVVGAGNGISLGTASVTGGRGNLARGAYSHVSGGERNQATLPYSSVSGGYENQATAKHASVSGGAFNLARAQFSSVSGGLGRHATDIYDWRAGDLIEGQ